MTFQEDAPGRLLAGKYELLEKLGQGGMAIVWRARTLGAAGFFRNVAIKRIEASVRGFEDGGQLGIVESGDNRRGAHSGRLREDFVEANGFRLPGHVHSITSSLLLGPTELDIVFSNYQLGPDPTSTSSRSRGAP